MQTARIITTEHEPAEKTVRAHVVSTRNLVIASILVALLAISGGVCRRGCRRSPGVRHARTAGLAGRAGVPSARQAARGPRGYRGKRGRAGKRGVNGANGARSCARKRAPTTSTSLCPLLRTSQPHTAERSARVGVRALYEPRSGVGLRPDTVNA